MEIAPQIASEEALRKIAALEVALEAMTEAMTTTAETLSKANAELALVRAERDKLRRAYEQLKGHLELLRRRIFLAKAERIDTSQLEIEFAETKAKLEKLAKGIDEKGEAPGDSSLSEQDGGQPPGNKPPGNKKTSKGSGRPKLRCV